MNGRQVTRCAAEIRRALSENLLNEIARETRFSRKLRKFTPFRAAWTFIVGFASGNIRTLADLLRLFTDLTDQTMGYKPFHDRLSTPAFPEFFRLLLESLIGTLLAPIQRSGRKFLETFNDIVIHDGTAFGLNDRLALHFPGVCTHTTPAAAEVHCTYSLYRAQCVTVSVAPYSQEEREFLPDPEDLKGKLILLDAGYGRTSYFKGVSAAGGDYICRGKGVYNPLLLRCYRGLPDRTEIEGKRLKDIVLPRNNVDLLVEISAKAQPSGRISHQLRLVAIYVAKEKRHVLLFTSLSPWKFSPSRIGHLYRLRWQIELLFKEFKSHTCLQKFRTANRHIAEGLIWASMIAVLFRRFLLHSAFRGTGERGAPFVAASMCWTYLRDIARSANSSYRGFKEALRRALSLLRRLAKRTNPQRVDIWAALRIHPVYGYA